MAEQVAHGDAVGRDGVVEPEFRDVFLHRLFPLMRRSSIKSANPVAVNDFVTEPIRNSIGCQLQAGFDIAKAIGPDERHLAFFAPPQWRDPEPSTPPSLQR